MSVDMDRMVPYNFVAPPMFQHQLPPWPMPPPEFNGRGGGGGGGGGRGGRGRRHQQPRRFPQHQQQGRGAGRHRKRPARESQDGAPSLAALERANRRLTKRFYRGYEGDTPRTVPNAPYNSNSMLAQGRSPSQSPAPGILRSVTPNPYEPGRYWKISYGSLGREAAESLTAAGIDLNGSNIGLVVHQSDDDSDEAGGYQLNMDAKGQGHKAVARIEEQDAYIAHLEDETLHQQVNLSALDHEARKHKETILTQQERIMDLEEKLYLAEAELKELRLLRDRLPTVALSATDDDASDSEAPPTSAAPEAGQASACSSPPSAGTAGQAPQDHRTEQVTAVS